jgi:hypothetical protein
VVEIGAVVVEPWLVMEAVDVLSGAEAGNSSTLFKLPLSATHRLPEESNAIPSGRERSLWVALRIPALGPVTKSGCPRTTVAFSPLVRGDEKPRILPFEVSDTQSIPV